MDRDRPYPLTPEQAKERLRAAAGEISPRQWLMRHPWRGVAVALVGGLVVGRAGTGTAVAAMLLRRIAPALRATMLSRRK